MNTQKIVFVVVLVAAGLFIASIATSMLPTKRTLANGYQISVGGRGETWVRSPDRQRLVTDVTSVWSSADRMLVERRVVDEKPPFEDRGCEYLAAAGRGVLAPIAKADALARIAGLKRETASPKTCIAAKG